MDFFSQNGLVETIKNGNGQIWVANSFKRVFDSVFPNTNTKRKQCSLDKILQTSNTFVVS